MTSNSLYLRNYYGFRIIYNKSANPDTFPPVIKFVGKLIITWIKRKVKGFLLFILIHLSRKTSYKFTQIVRVTSISIK